MSKKALDITAVCYLSPSGLLPVHSRKVTPEVPGPVSSRNLDGIDHHWVTLQEERGAAGDTSRLRCHSSQV